MVMIKRNPETLFPQYSNYSHAVEVPANSRILFISGINGYLNDGKIMPESFEAQGDIIWGYIGEVLRSAGMDYANIVSLRTYLADPSYDHANMTLRAKYLGHNEPSLTVICCQLLEAKWKLEIEAVAAAL